MRAKSYRPVRLPVTALFLAASIFLAGCSEDHFANSDFITRQAGDSVAVNKAVQTIDPWPKEAKNRKLDVEGKRAEVAIKRYEQNKVVPPKGMNTSTISGQSGPGAQSTTSIQN